MFSNPNCQSQYNGWSEAGLTLNVTGKRVILLQSSVSLFEGFDLAIRSHRHDQHMLLGDSHRDGDLRILPGNFVSAAWVWLVHKWLSEPALKIGFGCYARPNFAPGPAEPSTRSLRLLVAVADRKSLAICLECHPRFVSRHELSSRGLIVLNPAATSLAAISLKGHRNFIF